MRRGQVAQEASACRFPRRWKSNRGVQSQFPAFLLPSSLRSHQGQAGKLGVGLVGRHWKKLQGRGVWWFQGALQGESVLTSPSAAADWVKERTVPHGVGGPPLSSCSCSHACGQGTAVGPQTGTRCWSLLSGLWRAIAPLMQPWCAEGEVPTFIRDGTRG